MHSPTHSIPEDLRDVALGDLLKKRVVRFGEIDPDWDAFADSQVEGRRRAQHRMIGVGGSGKHDPKAIPAGGFTLSIMRLPPGQGGSAHTHEVEEAFFVLEGELTVDPAAQNAVFRPLFAGRARRVELAVLLDAVLLSVL